MEDKKLTFDEIMVLVIENCDGEDGEGIYGFCDDGIYYDIPNDFEPIANGSNWEAHETRRKNYARTQPLGYVEMKKHHGGEGKGEDYWSVQYFEKHDVYIKTEGWYQSYNGCEFDDGWESCKEVFPEQVTITVYNEKKK